MYDKVYKEIVLAYVLKDRMAMMDDEMERHYTRQIHKHNQSIF